MNRRDFLQAGAASLALSAAAANLRADDAKKPKVGLIGCGWYGKCDLFRLIQVADVEVVALCDVDSNMLAHAADMVSQRQKSKKKPQTYGDYRKMLKENELDKNGKRPRNRLETVDIYIEERRLNHCVTGNTSRTGKWEVQERPELRETLRIDAGKHTLNTRRHTLGDGKRRRRGLFDISVEPRVAQDLGRNRRRGAAGHAAAAAAREADGNAGYASHERSNVDHRGR